MLLFTSLFSFFFRDLKWLLHFPIGLLFLVFLSFFVCYCSGNNHSCLSLLDFCRCCCCWSSKVVGYIYMSCCLFPFMVCQSDGCFSSVDANFCRTIFKNVNRRHNQVRLPTVSSELTIKRSKLSFTWQSTPKWNRSWPWHPWAFIKHCCHIVFCTKNHRS